MRYDILEEDKFKDECGVFGIFSSKESLVAEDVYYGLYALQHRGQESAGIAVSNGKEITCHKDMGLVSDVFDYDTLKSLKGISAIGHVRYSTTGCSVKSNAQPLLGRYKLGNIAVAHNGNIVNADIIKGLLEDGGVIFQTSIDTEVVLNIIARSAKKGIDKALMDVVSAISGSYAMLLLTEDKLIGIRDPKGIRPLCIGKLNDSYILSSESCAIESIGGEFIRDVYPGEIVIIDSKGIRSLNFIEKTKKEVCSFEYIYFARPDSIMDGIDVYESRIKAGKQLYKECPTKGDIVIGVPDSGIPAAIGYAKASNIPYGIGFIKNKYVGRTFIKPTQDMRERAVSVKLNPLKSNVKDKRVIIIDDSIVRGTTSKKLVQSLRRAGAKEVHFKVASPMVKFPCYFGIDTPYRKELIGANLTTDNIKEVIGADSLEFLSINGLLEALGKKDGFCMGCFKGEYPVSAPIEMENKK